MFPDFPNFASLKLYDKDTYNQLVADLPPHSDISFITLNIWWNLGEQLSVSILNNNVVINYHLPFDKDSSGLGLIGKKSIDDSIVRLFGYLRQEHKEVKLVHVPDFTVQEIKKPELLNIVEEFDYNEYILDSRALAELKGASYSSTRRRVNRFLREVGDKKIELSSLELSSRHAKTDLLNYLQKWEKFHLWKNDPNHTEYQAMDKSLQHMGILDIRNLSVYIDGKLCAVIVYHKTLDQKFYIVHHLKVDYRYLYITDFATQQIAQKAVEDHVPYINMEMDLGIQGLREHKMSLKPVHFFKKYTIRPA